MKLICVLLLMSCLLVANYAFALSPTMNLEGGGILGPSAAASAQPTCSGNFNATLSGTFGTPVSSAPLTMTIEVTLPCPCPAAATPCPATCPVTGAAASAVSSVTSKSHNPNEEAQIKALQQQMQTLQKDVQSNKRSALCNRAAVEEARRSPRSPRVAFPPAVLAVSWELTSRSSSSANFAPAARPKWDCLGRSQLFKRLSPLDS